MLAPATGKIAIGQCKAINGSLLIVRSSSTELSLKYSPFHSLPVQFIKRAISQANIDVSAPEKMAAYFKFSMSEIQTLVVQGFRNAHTAVPRRYVITNDRYDSELISFS